MHRKIFFSPFVAYLCSLLAPVCYSAFSISAVYADEAYKPELTREQIRIKDYIITVTGTDSRRVTQTRIDHQPLPKTEEDDDDA